MRLHKFVALCATLMVACSALAQTAPNSHCSDVDRRAAKVLVQQLIGEVRSGEIESLRHQYFAATCQPVLTGYLELNNDTRTLDCATLQSSGEAFFEFMFLSMELAMGSENEPVEADDDAVFGLNLLPPEIAKEIERRPTLHQAFVANIRVSSGVQLKQFVSDARDVSTLSRRYLRDHPSAVALANARWKHFEDEAQPPTACLVSEDPETLGIAKGTPFISTTDSFFAFILVRDGGDLRIARIIPLQ
jgi:hypothetical protein